MSTEVRGIRGAITVERNQEAAIRQATEELLRHMVRENEVNPQDVASCWITVTSDLTAANPATTIRQLEGWDLVPLMCALEMPLDGGLPRCIRLLLHVNTNKEQRQIRHIYLRQAGQLRPDLQASRQIEG
ncbi:MAG TPA: chorismate mutase [Bacilli bacterium]|nr:chorismate mutase [Bacilli bacterium]